MKTKTTVSIDKDEVYRALGYSGHAPSAFISSLIDSQIAGAYKFIKPAYTYALKAIEGIKDREVFVDGYSALVSQTISYVVSDCRYVTIFLATIGNDLGGETSRLMRKGEMLPAITLDAIGTEAVEKTAGKLQDAVGEIARTMGCQATLRYSPGYCDWDITQQKVLFRAIDSVSLGVKLTKSCMMVPEKSISGIIGIGKFEATKPPPCLVVCGKRVPCPYKRTRL